MLPQTARTQRVLEMIQFVLTFVSVCAVLETSRIQVPLDRPPGLYAGIPQSNEASGDRRIGDLARAERRRREAAYQSIRQGIERSESNASAVRHAPS
jgi:hypothetical protein